MRGEMKTFHKKASSMAGKLLSSPSIMCMAALPNFSGISYGYFDGIFVVWLLIGIFRGRKRGMTQELLPTLQWLAIVILAGLFYFPFSVLIFQTTTGAFTHLWSNIIAYVLIAFGINLFFIWLKESIGEKLTGSDLFGRAEYYLGMFSGLLRFACMIVVLVALMHSYVYTQAQLAEIEKFQKKNFEEIRFPTYASVQQSVLTESCTGRLIQSNLSSVLIVSTTASTSAGKPAGPAAPKRPDAMNSILGPQK
jgi:uncharacterized membrane protein required for colicin V production